jgi:hypothetical protein
MRVRPRTYSLERPGHLLREVDQGHYRTPQAEHTEVQREIAGEVFASWAALIFAAVVFPGVFCGRGH